ncbi:MAG: 4Fe-4S dicluster domain-containing protein [Christensenellales bacterium]|jgi:2-oxoglutarate ferredoxin oxidoreductase subunit delta
MARITIDGQRCKGCGLCVLFCPKKILKLSDGALNVKGYRSVIVTQMDACTGCCSCARMCPDCVIEVEK